MSAGRAHVGERIATAFRAACRIELAALKPGNVHRHAEGHGMTVADFEASAEAAAPAIADPGRRAGARILAATEATWAAVGCNTNLGIVLLCAPLAMAAETAAADAARLEGVIDPARLEGATMRTLAALDIEDAALAFRAIARANPGGLGRAPAHDVHAPPAVGLRAAMACAAERDRIARQYALGYVDIFGFSLPSLRARLADGMTIETAASALYMTILARWPDSHVLRKFGDSLAQSVSDEAHELQRRFPAGLDDAGASAALLTWDAQLKSRGVNPGTSADLTVATLFAHLLLAR